MVPRLVLSLLLLSFLWLEGNGEEDLTEFYKKLSAGRVSNPRGNSKPGIPSRASVEPSPGCSGADGGGPSCSSNLFAVASPQEGPTQGHAKPLSARTQPRPAGPPVMATRGRPHLPPELEADYNLTEVVWSTDSPLALATRRPTGTGFGFVALLRRAWEGRAWGDAAGLLRSLSVRVTMQPHAQRLESSEGPSNAQLVSQIASLAAALQGASPGSPLPNERELLPQVLDALYWCKKGGEGVYEPGISMEGVLDPPGEVLELLQKLDQTADAGVVSRVHGELMRTDLFDQARNAYAQGDYVKGVEMVAGGMQMYSCMRELSKTYFQPNFDCHSPPPGWPWGCGRLESQLGFMEQVLKGQLVSIAEMHLMKWQLDQMAMYGEYSRAPDLRCEPLPAVKDPSLAVVMPFVASEAERIVEILQFWDRYHPCQGAQGKATAERQTGGLSGDWPHRHQTDLVLFFAGDAASLPAPFSDAQQWARFVEETASLKCFEHVRVFLGNLSAAEQSYPGRGHVDNTGPINLFFGVLGMNAAYGTSYDYALYIESDVRPIRPGWLTRVYGETLAPVGSGGIWMKGAMQNPPWAKVGVLSEHHYHMNMNWLVRLSDPCFIQLLKRVEAEFPRTRWPYDAAVHLFMRARHNYRFMQRFASRFVYSDFILNWLLNDPIPVEQLQRDYPYAVLIHAKNVKF